MLQVGAKKKQRLPFGEIDSSSKSGSCEKNLNRVKIKMNADVRRARIVGICGASGSGKSTLATTLARRHPSASASVLSCDAHFKRRLGGLSSADTPHADLSAGEEPSIINWEGVRAEAETRAAECDLLIVSFGGFRIFTVTIPFH